MKSARVRAVQMPAKAQTGIMGFDEITGGGLPRSRTTLLAGGPGTGKTIFALQFLVHGVREYKEPGIFVAFEETSERIIGNAEGFGWELAQLRRNKLFFLDAQPAPRPSPTIIPRRSARTAPYAPCGRRVKTPKRSMAK